MTDISHVSNASNGSSNQEEESTNSYYDSYRLQDSDSDEEDKAPHAIITNSHFDDLNELKEQTKELLDANWKTDKNRKLLNKMLELDEPTITPKMVDFLLQEGVMELLLEFITQLGGAPRPGPGDNDSPALKYSYRAAMLLSVDEPTDALITVLNKKGRLIAKAMFDVFRDDSAGSFYHAARVLESLLRTFPAEVFEGMMSDGKLVERMSALLKYIGCPPVGDLIVILIGLTPIPRANPLYVACAQSRWKLFSALSEWILMHKITDIIVNPNGVSFINNDVSAEQQSSSAAQTLQELVEKLSIEDAGEILLQPLGYTEPLLDGLLDCAMKSNEDVGQDTGLISSRRCSLRLLSYLLRRSDNPESICFISQPGMAPQPVLVPNRLYPLRVLIINHLVDRMSDIEAALIRERDTPPGEPVSHPGHVVASPFSSHRVQLVELLALLIEGSDAVAPMLTLDIWKTLIHWNFEYVHNNIYHSMFYRILFSTLRQNKQEALYKIFKESKFPTLLIDNFIEAREPVVGDDETKKKLLRKKALHGFIINCGNAVRLQVQSLPPSSYLRNFLHSHSAWNAFLPTLRAETEIQQTPGMGIRVPTGELANSKGEAIMSHLAALLPTRDKGSSGIDHGSAYAKSLGFEDEIDWPVNAVDPAPKKKKSNKKKKKNHRRKARSNSETSDGKSDEGRGDEDDDDEEETSEDGRDDSRDSEDAFEDLATSNTNNSVENN